MDTYKGGQDGGNFTGVREMLVDITKGKEVHEAMKFVEPMNSARPMRSPRSLVSLCSWIQPNINSKEPPKNYDGSRKFSGNVFFQAPIKSPPPSAGKLFSPFVEESYLHSGKVLPIIANSFRVLPQEKPTLSFSESESKISQILSNLPFTTHCQWSLNLK